MKTLGILFGMVGFMLLTLSPVEGWGKEDPSWNTDTCHGKLIQNLRVGQFHLKPTEKIYVVGQLVAGHPPSWFSLKGASHIVFRPITYQAKDTALKLPLAVNVTVYGRVENSYGQIIFNMYRVERGPSNRKVFQIQHSLLLSHPKTGADQWRALAKWALKKGIQSRDPGLVKKSQSCFSRAFRMLASSLNPKDPKHTDRFIKLILLYSRLNSTYQKLGRKDLVFPRSKILKLCKVVLKHRPGCKGLKTVLVQLGFVYYTPRDRTRKNFEKLQGGSLYQGVIGACNNKWVSKTLYKLLRACETRVQAIINRKGKIRKSPEDILDILDARFGKVTSAIADQVKAIQKMEPRTAWSIWAHLLELGGL